MLDNQVTQMTPGEILNDVPIQDMIQRLGVGIAEAQLRLDQASVRVATLLSGARIELTDAQGNASSKSLLELGFTPTFYHFTEAELEVKMTLSIKVEESFGVGISANVGNDAGSIQQAASGALGAAQGAAQGQSGGGASGGQAPASGGGDKRAVMFGAAINVEYHRKYNFDVTGSSTVRAKMVSVPPPTAFLEMLKEQARQGGTITAPPEVPASGSPPAGGG